jgi:hypothetical protein
VAGLLGCHATTKKQRGGTGIFFDACNFKTVYDEYAILVFKVHGAAYLQKPLDEEELGIAIQRCRKQVQQHEAPPADIAG